METKADGLQWYVENGETWLRIRVEDAQAARFYATENAGKPQRLKLTAWRNRRSLTANAYAWTLLGKLSEKLRIPPEEIYQSLIPDVGGNYNTAQIPLNSMDMLRRAWTRNGKGWKVELLGAAGPGLVDVILYYGSSVYDTAQMGRLIDLIIDECRENDIEYLPPDKIDAMLEDWNEKRTDESA